MIIFYIVFYYPKRSKANCNQHLFRSILSSSCSWYYCFEFWNELIIAKVKLRLCCSNRNSYLVRRIWFLVLEANSIWKCFAMLKITHDLSHFLLFSSFTDQWSNSWTTLMAWGSKTRKEYKVTDNDSFRWICVFKPLSSVHKRPRFRCTSVRINRKNNFEKKWNSLRSGTVVYES